MAGFAPPDTTADPARIEASATDLVTVANQITGRGDDLTASMALLGPQFSDLIAASITSQAGYNEQAWRAAARGVVYGAAVTSLWSTDVTWFKTERQKLVSEWHTAESTNFGVATPDTTGMGLVEKLLADTTYQARVANAKAATLVDLTTRATSLWEQFQQRAGQRGTQLSQGPTPENLAMLAQSGTPGITVTSLPNTGSGTSLINGDSGTADGTAVVTAINSDQPSEEFAGAMYRLDLVADDAYVKQLNGEQLSTDQIAYLNSFYGTLGYDVYRLPDYIQQNYDAAPPVGGDGTGGPGGADHWMLAAAGGGILALSNEAIGGGQDQLPPAIVELLEQPAVTYVNGMPAFTQALDYDGPLEHWNDSYYKFDALIAMTSATNPELEGGTRFSELLTVRTTEFAHATSLMPDGSISRQQGLDQVNFAQDDTLLQQALSVSTRNEQANYNIITGRLVSDDVTYPWYDSVRHLSENPLNDRSDFILDTLLGFDWNDDGAAAGGLIDWIGDDSQSFDEDGNPIPPERQARAQEAYIFLTSRLTGDGTDGHDPVRDYVDADGNVVHVDDTRLTTETVANDLRTNPKISDAIAWATAPNISLYATAADTTTWNGESGSLSMHDASRMLMLGQFTQDGRDTLTVASQAYKYDLLQYDDPTMAAETEQLEDGRAAGNVDGLVTASAENAIRFQHVDSADEANQQIEQNRERTKLVMDVTKQAASMAVSTANLPAGGATNWVLDKVLDQVPDIVAGSEVPVAPVSVDAGNLPLNWQNGGPSIAAYDVLNYLAITDTAPELATADGDPITATQPTGDEAVDQPVRVWVQENGYTSYVSAYTDRADATYTKWRRDNDNIDDYLRGDG